MNINLKAIKISLISSFGFAAVFAVFSLLFYFGDWERLSIVAFFGFFIGLIGAPEIEPKAFKYPRIVQLFSGMLAGAVVGYFFQLGSEYVIVAVLIGGLLGWLAPFWVSHAPIL